MSLLPLTLLFFVSQNQVLQEISDELTTIEAEESTEKPKLRYKYLIHSALIQHTAPLNQLDPDTKEPIRPDPPAASVSADGRASTPEPPVGTAAADNHKVTLKQESKGRRGLHIATCARWNSETDGVFNTKFEPGEDRDWDVIVSISWLSY